MGDSAAAPHPRPAAPPPPIAIIAADIQKFLSSQNGARSNCWCTRLLLYGYGINTVEESNVDTFFRAAIY